MNVFTVVALCMASLVSGQHPLLEADFESSLPRGWHTIGMPSLVDGHRGRGVLVDRGDAIYVQAPAALTNGFEIEMWVMHRAEMAELHFRELVYLYHETADLANRICLKKRIGTDEILFAMSDGGPAKGHEFAGDWYAMTSGPLQWPAGTWHHLRIVADPVAGRASLHIDGEQVATAEGSQFPAAAGTLWLGSWSGRSQAMAVFDDFTLRAVAD